MGEHFRWFVCILAFLTLLSGCATITRGTKDTLVVESDPVGANVTLSCGLSGKTPATFKVPRGDALLVKIEKEGYECVEVNVQSQVSGAGGAGMAGNVLLGGLIGAAVDAGTGAMKELRPNPVSVKLVEIAKSETPPQGNPPEGNQAERKPTEGNLPAESLPEAKVLESNAPGVVSSPEIKALEGGAVRSKSLGGETGRGRDIRCG